MTTEEQMKTRAVEVLEEAKQEVKDSIKNDTYPQAQYTNDCFLAKINFAAEMDLIDEEQSNNYCNDWGELEIDVRAKKLK